MEAILTKLWRYGTTIQELDLTEAFEDVSIASSNWGSNRQKVNTNLSDRSYPVTIATLCPNVRSLSLPCGQLGRRQVEALIGVFAAKKVRCDMYTLSQGRIGSYIDGWNTNDGAILELSQLHTLRLNPSWTDPSRMKIITSIGQGLRRLKLRMNLRDDRQRFSDPLPETFLRYELLLQHCGGYLQDLEIIPAPHFCTSETTASLIEIIGTGDTEEDNMEDSSDETVNPNTKIPTHQTLRHFTLYRPPLTRLHLGGVWFSEADVYTLARACPMITDLRLTNDELDQHLTPEELARIKNRDWRLQLKSAREIEWDRMKKLLPIELFLQLWGSRLRKLRLDGNRLCMHSRKTVEGYEPVRANPGIGEAVDGLNLPGINQTLPQFTPVSAQPYRLSSLCLFHAVGLMDDHLIAVVDSVNPTLQYLNVDRNIHLTDKSIRHVFMTCSCLLEFSAAELDLTMALFEDSDTYVEDEFIDQTNGDDGVASRRWACADTLRSLDLSWRSADGRAAHVQTRHGTENYYRTLETWDRNLRPYHHHRLYRKQCKRRQEEQRAKRQKLFDSDFEYVQYKQREEEWQEESQYEMFKQKRRKTRIPLRLFQENILPMFRKPWQIESVYERLRVLSQLEVLQLEGWLIPWRPADITAFLGYYNEPGLNPCKGSRGVINDSLRPSSSMNTNRLVTNTAEFAVLSTIYQPPTNHYDPTALRAIPRSNLAKLKYLNIQCKQPLILENPVGLKSPFELGGGDLYCGESLPDVNSAGFAPALFSQVHPIPNSGTISIDSTSTTRKCNKSMLCSILGAFMKACPRLKTFAIRVPTGAEMNRDSDLLGWHILDGHAVRLATTATTENATTFISDRRVHCTSRVFPEYSVIRELA
ncbi:hypothetical protein BGX21_008149 [Mortierella sp. AD011]|nr:hypothetical protein BGX21_008149 [Mortierella sp. AD011]